MALPQFPAYAILLLDGFSRQRDSTLNRTDMESGPAKQAPRVSKGMIVDSVTCGFDSKADYLAFLSWHETDLVMGSKWFTFTDPIDGVTKKARIPGGKLDEEKPLNSALSLWTVKFKIERWI